MHIRRAVDVGIFMLGVIGALLGAAGLIGVWYARGRIDQAVTHVFRQTDQSLVTVRKFLVDVQDRVHSAKITAQEITQRVKVATREKTRARMVDRLGIEEKTNRLGTGLAQAAQWIDLSISSVQSVRTGLELLQATSLPVRTETADKLLDELATVRTRLAKAIESVHTLRQRAASDDSRLAPGARLEKLARAGGRLLATVSSIDQQLGTLETRVAGVQKKLRQFGATTLRYLLAAAIAGTLLIMWMSAGQVALARYGWRGETPAFRQPFQRAH